jgi:alpha-mannosidase
MRRHYLQPDSIGLSGAARSTSTSCVRKARLLSLMGIALCGSTLLAPAHAQKAICLKPPRSGQSRSKTAGGAAHDIAPPKIRSVSSILMSRMIVVRFSEPLDRTSAETTGRYRLPPGNRIMSSTLDKDRRTVTLTLAAPLAGDAALKLAVTGVRAASGRAILPHMSPMVEIVRPVFELAAAQSFGGTGDGLTKGGVPKLPTAANAPWTLNLFVTMDTQPEERTIIGGFGDGSRAAGQQRYLIQRNGGIHFWDGSVDAATEQPIGQGKGQPFDPGRWQMITITYDGRTVRIYKNGQEIHSETAALADALPIVRLAPPPAWSNGHPFAGKIQNFTVWNRALDAASVRALLTLPFHFE